MPRDGEVLGGLTARGPVGGAGAVARPGRWTGWALAEVLIVGVLIALVGYLAVVARRGLDTTDEGFYLIAARYPGEVTHGVTSMHHYLGAVFRLLGYDIVALRRLGVLALVASAVVLALGLARLIGHLEGSRIAHPASFVGLTGVGTLLYYGWFLPTPSYNLLNAALLNTALGCFFFSLDGRQKGGWRWPPRTAEVSAFAAGLAIGMTLFVKFPTAIVTLAGLVVAYLLWPGKRFGRSARLALALLSGFAVWLALHFAVVEAAPRWWGSMRDGLEAARVLNPGAGVGETLARYRGELVVLGRRAVRLALYPCLGLIALAAALRLGAEGRAWRARWWVAAAAAAAIGLVAVSAHRQGLYVGGMTYPFRLSWFHLGGLLLMGSVTLAVRSSPPAPAGDRQATRGDRVPGCGRRRSVVLLVLMLLVAPFAFCLGTSNPLGNFSSLSMSSWFALYAWTFHAQTVSRPGRAVGLVGLVFVLAFAASQIVLGSWRDPYRLAGTLGDQSVPTAVGSPATTLSLDEPTSRFINDARRILEAHGFQPGSEMLNFFSMQGVVFAVGGRSLGTPWLTAGYPGTREYAEQALARVAPSRLRRAFILETPGDAADVPDLTRFGLDFPASYILCGELTVPYPWFDDTLRIWKPRQLPGP